MPKSKQAFVAKSRFTDLFPEISGNTINGRGETAKRRPKPFFWHPPDRQTHGDLQTAVIDYHRQSAAIRKEFSPNPPGGRGPQPIEQAKLSTKRSPDDWSQWVKKFALENESDLVGITALDPMYVYEGYEIKEPWVITIGVTMDYEELSQAPPTFDNPATAVVDGRHHSP